MPALNALNLESVSPVYTICCGEALQKFTNKKSLHSDPVTDMEEGAVLAQCFERSVEKLSSSPCARIQKDYANCLVSHKGRMSYLARIPCRSIQLQLEECAAKHVGKLD